MPSRHSHHSYHRSHISDSHFNSASTSSPRRVSFDPQVSVRYLQPSDGQVVISSTPPVRDNRHQSNRRGTSSKRTQTIDHYPCGSQHRPFRVPQPITYPAHTYQIPPLAQHISSYQRQPTYIQAAQAKPSRGSLSSFRSKDTKPSTTHASSTRVSGSERRYDERSSRHVHEDRDARYYQRGYSVGVDEARRERTRTRSPSQSSSHTYSRRESDSGNHRHIGIYM